jgi:ABC-type phosphate transport system permease subunit
MKRRAKSALKYLKERRQSALEYLMTYGWGLIVVALIMGILIFVTTPSWGAMNCSNFGGFLVKNAYADTEKIQLHVQNITGDRINGLAVYADIIYPESDSPPLFSFMTKKVIQKTV